ncbi:unnamed protein product, partial [Urochloa humidicola]
MHPVHNVFGLRSGKRMIVNLFDCKLFVDCKHAYLAYEKDGLFLKIFG